MKRKSVWKLQNPIMMLIAVFLVFVIVVGVGKPTLASPKTQKGINLNLRYALLAVPGDANRVNGNKMSLCLGEEGTINVYMGRRINGQPSNLISGGRVYGTVGDSNIVMMTNPGENVTVEIIGSPAENPRAVFTIRAERVGTTSIQFSAFSVGDETLFGPGLSARGDSIEVEVSVCFEAIKSALGVEWPQKDICSFKKPFLLEAAYPGVEIGPDILQTSKTRVLFFLPSPREMLNGWYVFVNEITISAPGGTSNSIEVGNGNYEVNLGYTSADIELKGSSVYCSESDCYRVGFSGYKIQTDALPEGQACKESIP